MPPGGLGFPLPLPSNSSNSVSNASLNVTINALVQTRWKSTASAIFSFQVRPKNGPPTIRTSSLSMNKENPPVYQKACFSSSVVDRLVEAVISASVLCSRGIFDDHFPFNLSISSSLTLVPLYIDVIDRAIEESKPVPFLSCIEDEACYVLGSVFSIEDDNDSLNNAPLIQASLQIGAGGVILPSLVEGLVRIVQSLSIVSSENNTMWRSITMQGTAQSINAILSTAIYVPALNWN